jgi:alanine racemase
MRPDIRTRRPRPPFRTNIASYPIGYADGLKRARLTSGDIENFPLNLNKQRYRWLSDVYAMGHSTKSLRSSPLRGGVSREAGNKPRG